MLADECALLFTVIYRFKIIESNILCVPCAQAIFIALILENNLDQLKNSICLLVVFDASAFVS